MPQFIYRWTTAAGATHYSQVPPTEQECPPSNEYETIPLQSELSNGNWTANVCGRLYTAEQEALRSQYFNHLVQQAKENAVRDELLAHAALKEAREQHCKAYQYYREVKDYTEGVLGRYNTMASEAYNTLRDIDTWQDVIDVTTLGAGLITLPFSGTAALAVGTAAYVVGTANDVARSLGRYDGVTGLRDVSAAVLGGALLRGGARPLIAGTGEVVAAAETLDGALEILPGSSPDDESVEPLRGPALNTLTNLEAHRQSLLNQAERIDARARDASYLENAVGVDLHGVSRAAREGANALQQLKGPAQALAEAETALNEAIAQLITVEGGWLYIDVDAKRLKELRAKADAAGLQAWKEHAEKP